MIYNVKMPLGGFEGINTIELLDENEHYAKLVSKDDKRLELRLLNPYSWRNYGFDIPINAQVLLDIKKDTRLKIMCITVVQVPEENSYINFLAPLIFNEENKTMMQIMLPATDYPHYKFADSIKNYMKEA